MNVIKKMGGEKAAQYELFVSYARPPKSVA